MSLNAVAAYLQFLRKGRGLSQEELADRINVPRLAIERFERAGGDISEETLRKIIDALGAAEQHIRYLEAARPTNRDESAQLIRRGIDLARSWLEGRDLLREEG